MYQEEVLEIGANCILRLKNRFFLVVEIEADVPGVELEIFTIARIDKETARRLFDAGIEMCEVTNKVPKPNKGREVEFICIFIDRDKAFALFDVEEGGEDEAVFVRISLEEAKCAIRKGARHCTVVDAREHC
ncbi:hypothetical protein ACFW35_05430 [Fictibacillus sp. NPDC058756]|uniref:hypothetical protein n=1 Tax=Fictibacillus sp. NPDC058756 TaxID=3346625 RepID=UPI0036B7B525